MAYLQPRKTERELMFLAFDERRALVWVKHIGEREQKRKTEEREQVPMREEGPYMVKSHVASDISCTIPADSVPPVPALLHILARKYKWHQSETAIFRKGRSIESSIHVQPPSDPHSLLHNPIDIFRDRDVRLHIDRLSVSISLADQIVGSDVGLRSAPSTASIWAKVGTDNEACTVGGEFETDCAAEAGGGTRYDGNLRSQALRFGRSGHCWGSVTPIGLFTCRKSSEKEENIEGKVR